MPYHLPVLLNPLINAVFNCPNPATSNLKKLFSRLESQKFILLVPPCHKLLKCKDSISGTSLQELCYSFDFVASHVLLIDEQHGDSMNATPLHQIKFDTLNGKKVLVRSQNRVIITSDGFQSKKRCKITNVELFANFNDYLQQSDHFPLIYIDEPLCGDLIWVPLLAAQLETGIDKGLARGTASLAQDTFQRSKASFENILRIHPDWTNRFNNLFVEYRSTPVANGPCEEVFHEIVQRAYSIMSTDSLFQAMPDLFDLVYEYIELNLYDDIWVRLTNHFKSSEVELEGLRYVSINQIETNLYSEEFQDFELRKVVYMEKNIESAVKSFNRLTLTHAHSDKSDALVETLRNLCKTDDRQKEDGSPPIAMDADTLLSFFVLIVYRTQVKNLKSQLFYLQRFAKDEGSVKFGVLGYAISTLEAVVCYFENLEGTKRADRLEKESKQAHKLIEMLSSDYRDTSFDIQQFQNFWCYRTEHGESLLSICVIHGKNEFLLDILRQENNFPLEDILEDENTDGCTLLMQALKCGNSTAAAIIVDTLMVSSTAKEKYAYFNRCDKHNRTAAHYLTHEIGILRKIGRFIKWNIKDSSGHTPLFTIFRSYDQQNYEQMISASFCCAAEWYKSKKEPFNFHDHEDYKGNTLLHILKRRISILLKYDTIDVNATNKKGLTPLMVYAKYNRLDNIKAILNDNRVILGKVQSFTLLNCFDYARNPLILHELAKQAAKNTVFGKCFVHTLKYESSSWLLHITLLRGQKEEYQTVEFHLKTIQNFFRLLLKKNTMSFLPLDTALEQLSNLGRTRISTIGKIETLQFLRRLTNCFNAIFFVQTDAEGLMLGESTLVSWIKSQAKVSKNFSTRSSSSKRVEPEEMSSIQNFLRFNQAELFTVKTKLQVMKKLAIFLRLKSGDVGESQKLLFLLGSEYIDDSSHLFDKIEYCDLVRGNGAMTTLVEEIDFLLKCTSRLYNHIHVLLQDRIPEWWNLYGELLGLHKQYAQNFPHLVNNDDSLMDSGIIGKFLEGKKAKLEKKLSESISEIRRSMNQAGSNIAYDHELLAEELSRFMEFKGAFFRGGIIRKWVRENINIMRESLVHKELQKG